MALPKFAGDFANAPDTEQQDDDDHGMIISQTTVRAESGHGTLLHGGCRDWMLSFAPWWDNCLQFILPLEGLRNPHKIGATVAIFCVRLIHPGRRGRRMPFSFPQGGRIAETSYLPRLCQFLDFGCVLALSLLSHVPTPGAPAQAGRYPASLPLPGDGGATPVEPQQLLTSVPRAGRVSSRLPFLASKLSAAARRLYAVADGNRLVFYNAAGQADEHAGAQSTARKWHPHRRQERRRAMPSVVCVFSQEG